MLQILAIGTWHKFWQEWLKARSLQFTTNYILDSLHTQIWIDKEKLEEAVNRGGIDNTMAKGKKVKWTNKDLQDTTQTT